MESITNVANSGIKKVPVICDPTNANGDQHNTDKLFTCLSEAITDSRTLSGENEIASVLLTYGSVVFSALAALAIALSHQGPGQNGAAVPPVRADNQPPGPNPLPVVPNKHAQFFMYASIALTALAALFTTLLHSTNVDSKMTQYSLREARLIQLRAEVAANFPLTKECELTKDFEDLMANPISPETYDSPAASWQ
jgi:hypothetical protein